MIIFPGTAGSSVRLFVGLDLVSLLAAEFSVNIYGL
jgi:hypothetical protein